MPSGQKVDREKNWQSEKKKIYEKLVNTAPKKDELNEKKKAGFFFLRKLGKKMRMLPSGQNQRLEEIEEDENQIEP